MIYIKLPIPEFILLHRWPFRGGRQGRGPYKCPGPKAFFDPVGSFKQAYFLFRIIEKADLVITVGEFAQPYTDEPHENPPGV